MSVVVWLVIRAGKGLGVWCRPSDVELVKKDGLIVGREVCDPPLAAFRCGAGLDVASAHDL